MSGTQPAVRKGSRPSDEPDALGRSRSGKPSKELGRPPAQRRALPPRWAQADRRTTGEEGQILILLLGLVGLILMVLGLGWDASNWFLGHRALDNLADGAAIAAASDVDLRAFYASNGREITISNEQALTTVRRYLSDAAGDSGLEGVAARSVRVERVANGPRVTVELQAATPVAFLRYLSVVAPEMVGSATATAELQPP
jgi:uncharacterized membrane protein